MIQWKEILLGMVIGVLLMLPISIYEWTRPAEVKEIPFEVRDTVTITKDTIIFKTRTEYVTKFDTVYQVIDGRDTIEIPVELPIEHKVYQDTIRTDTTEIALDIKYSGFKPSLDEVGLIYHLSTKRAVETKKKPKLGQYFGVGFSVGAGAGFNPLTKAPSLAAPEVSIGLQYGFGITW